MARPLDVRRAPGEEVSRDQLVLTVTRALRGFASGALAVSLGFELPRVPYALWQIGLFLGVAMAAAAAWALLVPRGAVRLSRRMLFLLGALSVSAGGFLLWFDLANPGILLVALLLGGIVAGGSDISPLASLEQGALSQSVAHHGRTRLFSFYNLAGYLGTAIGAAVAGPLLAVAWVPSAFPWSPRDGALLLYGVVGLLLVPSYLALSREDARGDRGPVIRPLSQEHRRPVLELSGLFTVDAFGGGLIANTLVVLFLSSRFAAPAETIGIVLSLANLAAAFSLALAAPLARRFGLVKTMVFTHIPSSALLILFAFAPTLLLAASLWVARASLSQMDVPTRQSYTQAIVPKDEGSAAAGYTTAARSAQALGGPVSGALLSAGGPWLSAPFALAGAVKIAYDVALYGRFRDLRPPEERVGEAPP
ncbi:MAG: MFS transporter [Euryarchaeota archaeon]|nr:MFS transporter [Euryarchaeota archaeon]MDE1837996.1 MFS transporter [Euryarchaeota archaeon]MDE1880650.1 MFS transporter [Euryarchaeota archaeon]MDE2046451.1 MFS transporter [Thermoplasmata archaeon]